MWLDCRDVGGAGGNQIAGEVLEEGAVRCCISSTQGASQAQDKADEEMKVMASTFLAYL